MKKETLAAALALAILAVALPAQEKKPDEQPWQWGLDKVKTAGSSISCPAKTSGSPPTRTSLAPCKRTSRNRRGRKQKPGSSPDGPAPLELENAIHVEGPFRFRRVLPTANPSPNPARAMSGIMTTWDRLTVQKKRR